MTSDIIRLNTNNIITNNNKIIYIGGKNNDNQKHGLGTIFINNKPIIVGEFYNNMKHGHCVKYNLEGTKIFSGLYKNDMKNGIGFHYYDNKIVRNYYYKDELIF